MGDPVLHLIVGPNGSGKSTLYETVIGPSTRLEFVNADVIAAQRWPEAAVAHSYDAARLAARQRARLIDEQRSFVAETVFSHESKVHLIEDAVASRYLVTLHVVMVPEALSVARVHNRVVVGGHDVPDDKIRGRFRRLWPLVTRAIAIADHAIVYDNTRAAQPFRVVAEYARGARIGAADWPTWTPAELLEQG
ncbi:MAG TPA: zeta toxin family protein [Acidimicrobiales bacterium]|nr:zeta toxin family protein [Acidimicrobiales bacterium]